MPSPISIPAPLTPHPCPFCGSSAVRVAQGEGRVSVDCTACYASGPALWLQEHCTDGRLVKAQAVQLWNKCTRQASTIEAVPLHHQTALFGKEANRAA